MTLEEARKVAGIIENADGGCGYCVEVLREMCENIFPEFEWRKADYASVEVYDKASHNS